jgi:hypothetical protein
VITGQASRFLKKVSKTPLSARIAIATHTKNKAGRKP